MNLIPNRVPILTPNADIINVVIPINIVAYTMFTPKNANVIPTAIASMLVAIAKTTIVLKSKEELSIVDDQISSPTYSKDLAYYSWKLIKTKKYGLYHLSNDGEASKYDQAEYVLDKINWQGRLNRAKTKDFNLKAERAEYTKLTNDKLEKVINKKIPTWQNGIDRFLEEIK